MVPHARVGGIAGLIELLQDRGGREDLFRLSEELVMDVEDLLPILEACVLLGGEQGRTELPPALFGTQAQRRRWLKKKFYGIPGSPVMLFLYRYFFRLGFLDGVPGLIYCGFQAVQMFHTKAKIYELKAQVRQGNG